jgi:hypothetical protein
LKKRTKKLSFTADTPAVAPNANSIKVFLLLFIQKKKSCPALATPKYA